MRRAPILALAAVVAMPAEAAETLDASLSEIAGQIVSEAVARAEGEAPVIVGVSTFTHHDGSCSDLTNFVSELLVGSLYEAADGRLRLIERSALAAIFRERELSYDGTIAPEAARSLGQIEGVQAIVTGTVTEFGERVVIQSRLIGTGDGTVLAPARSSFPVVDTIEGMMAERSRGACGFAAPAEEAAAEPGATVQATVATDAARPGPPAARTYASDAFEAEIVSLTYAAATGEASVGLRFANTTDAEIGLSYLPRSLAVSDGAGGVMERDEVWSGLRECDTTIYFSRCNTSDPRYATVIDPGKFAQLNFNLAGAKDLEAPSLTLTFDLIVTPDTADTETYDVRSVGFFDVEPEMR